MEGSYDNIPITTSMWEDVIAIEESNETWGGNNCCSNACLGSTS